MEIKDRKFLRLGDIVRTPDGNKIITSINGDGVACKDKAYKWAQISDIALTPFLLAANGYVEQHYDGDENIGVYYWNPEIEILLEPECGGFLWRVDGKPVMRIDTLNRLQTLYDMLKIPNRARCLNFDDLACIMVEGLNTPS